MLFGNTVVATDNGTGAGTWTNNLLTITATATTENLVFQALNVGGNPSIGNEVDDVSLVPTTLVPEPGTLGLLAVGLVGLSWLRRRRQA